MNTQVGLKLFKVFVTSLFVLILTSCQHFGFGSYESEPKSGGLVFRILPPKNIPLQIFTLQLKNMHTDKFFSLKQNTHTLKSMDKLWSLPVGKYQFVSLTFVQSNKAQKWAPKKHPVIFIENNKISNLGLYKFGSIPKRLIVLHQIPDNFYRVPKKQHVTDIDVIHAFNRKTQTTLKAPKKPKTTITRKVRTKTSLSNTQSYDFDEDQDNSLFQTKTAPMISTRQSRSPFKTPSLDKNDMNYKYKRSIMFKYSVNLGRHTNRYGRSMIATLEKNHRNLQQCYKDRLDAGMPIRGNIRMNFEYDGRIREVQSLASRESDLVDGKLNRCLSTTLEKINFNIEKPMRGLVNFKLNYLTH